MRTEIVTIGALDIYSAPIGTYGPKGWSSPLGGRDNDYFGIGGLEDDPGPPPGETGADGTPTDTGEIIRWAQHALTTIAARFGKGAFDPRGVDGIAGPNTASAVRAFQAWAGITVDGLIGPQTIASLTAKLSAAPLPVGPRVAGVPIVPIAIGIVGVAAVAWWLKRRRRK